MVVYYTPDWLDIALHFAQIAFYLIVPTVAIYSYSIAKKNLSTPLQVEYKKLSISRLNWMSEQLSEFLKKEQDLEFYYDYEKWFIMNIKRRIGDKDHRPLTQDIYHSRFGENYPFSELLWLEKFRSTIETDPLIPLKLREDLKEYFDFKIRKTPSLLSKSLTIFFDRHLSDEKNADDEEVDMILTQLLFFVKDEFDASGLYLLEKDEKIAEFRERIREEFKLLTSYN